MAATNVSSLTSLAQSFSATRSIPSSKASSCFSHPLASGFVGASLPITSPKKKVVKSSWKIRATAAVETAPVEEEIKDFILPSWAMFELGRAPVYWKTMNGLPPTAGEKLKVFYNPAANKLVPNEEYGVAFNGGFNQPIMCGGEPRAMRRTDRGTADGPIFTIQIVIPKHALNVIFSFTNGVDWDGPYRLRFQVPKAWRNRPIEFFNEGLAGELSKEGACERAIFPDSSVIVPPSCTMVGNLSVEGGDRCDLDLVPGCMDPSSHLFDPLANVDDGSCPIDTSDSEE